MTERRIYYEDTDAGGVVYYANYLRYLEQGRTEFLRAKGLSLRALHEQGYLIPVMRLEGEPKGLFKSFLMISG